MSNIEMCKNKQEFRELLTKAFAKVLAAYVTPEERELLANTFIDNLKAGEDDED
ncbi:MAG: hypothetical protein OSJ43_16310 [Oscillospiraceae bacterium]|nr:hypothetical protein [Oscillospiraceae bacterium]